MPSDPNNPNDMDMMNGPGSQNYEQAGWNPGGGTTPPANGTAPPPTAASVLGTGVTPGGPVGPATPAVTENLKHNIVGKVASFLLGDERTTGYQADEQGQIQPVKAPQKPGSLFRSILAGSILGAMGGQEAQQNLKPGASPFMGGMAGGAGLVRANAAQQDQQMRQQAQQNFTNKQTVQKNEAEVTHLGEETKALQAQEAMWNVDQQQKVANFDWTNQEHMHTLSKWSQEYRSTMESTGAAPGSLRLADGSTKIGPIFSGEEIVGAVNKDPNMIHASSPDLMRTIHYIPDDTDVHFDPGKGRWVEDNNPDKVVAMSGKTQFAVYDVDNKPHPYDNDFLNKIHPGLGLTPGLKSNLTQSQFHNVYMGGMPIREKEAGINKNESDAYKNISDADTHQLELKTRVMSLQAEFKRLSLEAGTQNLQQKKMLLDMNRGYAQDQSQMINGMRAQTTTLNDQLKSAETETDKAPIRRQLEALTGQLQRQETSFALTQGLIGIPRPAQGKSEDGTTPMILKVNNQQAAGDPIGLQTSMQILNQYGYNISPEIAKDATFHATRSYMGSHFQVTVPDKPGQIATKEVGQQWLSKFTTMVPTGKTDNDGKPIMQPQVDWNGLKTYWGLAQWGNNPF